MASSIQWLVKIGVALALTTVLAIGLPLAMGTLAHRGPLPSSPFFLSPVVDVAVLFVTVGSLYVSSVATSGVKAVMAAVFVAALAMPLVSITGSVLALAVRIGVRAVRRQPGVVVANHAHGQVWLSATAAALFFGFCALLLVLGGANHRSSLRGARRTLRQATVLAAYLVTAASLLGVLAALFEAGVIGG
jgi:hypothetical protein